MIRVIIVDDHPLIRQGVASILAGLPDIDVVGQGGSGEEFEALLHTTQPDVVVLDLNMPATAQPCANGAQRRFRALPAIASASARYPNTRLLILSQYLDLILIEGAAHVGVAGYLLKDDGLTLGLPTAIRKVAGGGVYFSQAVTQLLKKGKTAQNGKRPETLTPRELELMRRILEQPSLPLTSHADVLNISPHTLHTHLKNIYARLEVNNLTAAVVKLIRAGALDAWDSSA